MKMPARSLGYVNAIPMVGNIFREPKQQQQRKRNLFRFFFFLGEGIAGGPYIHRTITRIYIPVRAN